MQFLRNREKTKFICSDSNQCYVISVSETMFNLSGYKFSFNKLPGEVLEESTHDEFFKVYDSITSRFTEVASKRHRGIKALLSDSPIKK